jgi:hypothetical protein
VDTLTRFRMKFPEPEDNLEGVVIPD